MKSDFVSLVSHQLKTPVVGIKLGIENMLGGLTGELTAKQRRYLQEMYEICSRSHRLITDLLNVSRIERGVLSVDIEPVKLREIVDLALRDYQKDIKKRGLALKLQEVDEGVVVLADVDKMVEALSNVINNAVKFTDKGSIAITITDGITREGKYGIVEVRDTGIGMSDRVLNSLFTKEKVLNGPPIAGGGVGIGLYIAKNFMEAQKGDITATSVVGEGSTFVLRVPRDRRGQSRKGV
jgi:signal transduction histidine kinase